MNTGRQASERATLHVDVGPELSARVRAAAAAGGRTPSEWTRELLQRELRQETAQEAASADARHQQPQARPDATVAAPGRLVLDAELASSLRQVQLHGQLRSRPAALRLVLRQYLGQMQGQGQAQAQSIPAPTDIAPLKDAVAALMRSNHELVPMGRNLNQVAKSLHQQRASLRVIDVMKLEAVAKRLKEHVAQAAQVTAALRSLVTPKKDPP